MKTISFMDTFHQSCASATDQDTINYPLALELCSILEPNPIVQTFSSQGYNLFTEIGRCQTSQPMETTVPNKSSDNATLNCFTMTEKYNSDEICKVPSFPPSSNQTQPCCGNMHGIQPIHIMNTFSFTDTTTAGTVNDRNIANNGSPNDRSNTTKVLSLQQMLDVNFVNSQQQNVPQISGNSDSNTWSVSSQSLGTSGSVPIYHHGHHWGTKKTISLMDTFSRSGTSTIDQDSMLRSILEPNPITQSSFSCQEYNLCTEDIDHSGIPKSTDGIVLNTFLDDATFNDSEMAVNHCDESQKIQSIVSSLYQTQPSRNSNMDDNELLPFKDTSRVVGLYDNNTMNDAPNDRFDNTTTEILSLRMFAEDFVHQQQQQQQQHQQQQQVRNNSGLNDQDELLRTRGLDMAMTRLFQFEGVGLESDDDK